MNEKSLVTNGAGLLQDESGAEDSLNGVRVTAMQPHTLADRMAYVATRVSWSELEEKVESTLESIFNIFQQSHFFCFELIANHRLADSSESPESFAQDMSRYIYIYTSIYVYILYVDICWYICWYTSILSILSISIFRLLLTVRPSGAWENHRQAIQEVLDLASGFKFLSECRKSESKIYW